MVTKENVLEALKKCNDPEVGLSIVDLGMIEEVSIEKDKVCVGMVLTNPSCPWQATIAQNAHSKVVELEGVSEAEVVIMSHLRWSPARLSPEAQKHLGLDNWEGKGG